MNRWLVPHPGDRTWERWTLRRRWIAELRSHVVNGPESCLSSCSSRAFIKALVKDRGPGRSVGIFSMVAASTSKVRMSSAAPFMTLPAQQQSRMVSTSASAFCRFLSASFQLARASNFGPSEGWFSRRTLSTILVSRLSKELRTPRLTRVCRVL